MALRKVFMEPLSSSTKGSRTGNLREPHRVECSRMWKMPVLSSGRVLKMMENSLFFSPLSSQISCAPLLTWTISTRVPFSSALSRTRVTAKPYCLAVSS